MLYNRLSDGELERAVYIDPANIAARDEMLRRQPVLMDTRTDEAQDLEMQLEGVRKEHATEIKELEADAEIADKNISSLRSELNDAHERIATLSRATDLV